jgi:hypothetical protein
MKLSNQRAKFGLSATSEPRSSNTKGNAIIGSRDLTIPLNESDCIYTVAGVLANGDKLELDLTTNDASASEISTSAILDPAGEDNANQLNGKPRFEDTGGDYELKWEDSKWKMLHPDNLPWESEDDVATPDLVTTWTPPPNGSTGTPTVTALAGDAARAIDALNTLDGITAANAPDNDGSGTIAETSVSLPHGFIRGGDQTDWEGDPLGTLDKITGFFLRIVSGEARAEINGDEVKSLTAGDIRQAANAAGMPSYLYPLELTASDDNTEFEIVVTGTKI